MIIIKQYKSCISSLEEALLIKDKEISKLSSTVFQVKNNIKDLKKSAECRYRELEDIIFVEYLKIIALEDQIISFAPYKGVDGTIEPNKCVY
ncbi:hypothetical protein C1645_826965 [Glomus cerebriforme]|uniref:Uncharacterized protein n=1 Tax=Glomus cerebriforme TaxID=658196 RepID=A0A397SPG7_9GLOM|nr:hypothetical protein C1645_826965 [Glomus cerebriforme]